MEKTIKSIFGYTLKLVSNCKIKISEDSSTEHITAFSDGRIEVYYNGEFMNTYEGCSVCLGDNTTVENCERKTAICFGKNPFDKHKLIQNKFMELVCNHFNIKPDENTNMSTFKCACVADGATSVYDGKIVTCDDNEVVIKGFPGSYITVGSKNYPFENVELRGKFI
jgi:hypothetical protein